MPPSDLEACVDAFAAELGYVYDVLLRHGVTESDADDLGQEVFLVLWRRWGSYDHQRPLRAWLRGIALRLAIKHRSREHARREVPGGFVDRTDESPNPEERIDAASLRSLLLEVLALLPEKQRTVLLLHEVEGIAMRDVADVLEVPLQTAHTRLRAARAELTKRLRRVRSLGGAPAEWADLTLLHRALIVPREAPPLSAERRGRALSRARALAALSRAGRGASWMGRPLAGAALATAALAGVVIVHLGGGRADATSAIASRAADPRGLVAHFSFDESPGGTIARDGSGRGNDCAVRGRRPAGVDWRSGRQGGAIDLNGYGWLECPPVADMTALDDEVTIAAWVKRTGERENVRSLVTWQYRPEALDYFQFGFQDEHLFLRARAFDRPVAARVGPPRERWTHVALTVAADGLARFFLDGVAVHSARTNLPRHFGPTSHPMLIGALENQANPHRAREVVQAWVDDLAIYDRALAPEEIAALARTVTAGARL
jgi:RNA polymerase sigma-70 factor (ECF subfamily)